MDSKDYKCEYCGKVSKASISTRLIVLPDVLVLQLKRFSYPSMKKVRGVVKFPFNLSMKDFTEPIDKAASTDYELLSVIVHKGTLNYGHYYAIGKRADKVCNGEVVRACSGTSSTMRTCIR